MDGIIKAQINCFVIVWQITLTPVSPADGVTTFVINTNMLIYPPWRYNAGTTPETRLTMMQKRQRKDKRWHNKTEQARQGYKEHNIPQKGGVWWGREGSGGSGLLQGKREL